MEATGIIALLIIFIGILIAVIQAQTPDKSGRHAEPYKYIPDEEELHIAEKELLEREISEKESIDYQTKTPEKKHELELLKIEKERPNRNQLEFVKSVSLEMKEVRLWKDKKGRIWQDPHPAKDLIPGEILFLIAKPEDRFTKKLLDPTSTFDVNTKVDEDTAIKDKMPNDVYDELPPLEWMDPDLFNEI